MKLPVTTCSAIWAVSNPSTHNPFIWLSKHSNLVVFIWINCYLLISAIIFFVPVNLGGYNTIDGRRTRTNSESRGQIGAQIDGLLDDLNRMGQTQQYRTVVNHEMGTERSHIPRWSSLQAVGDNAGRYATTLTRRHVKKGGTAPVEFLIKQPVIWLVTIKNRKFNLKCRS